MTVTVPQDLRLGEPYGDRANSLLVQIPTWADMVDFGQGKAQMNHGYPRSIVHPDIRLVRDDKECTDASLLLFSGARTALSCKQYILHLAQATDRPTLADSIRVYVVDFSGFLCRDHHAAHSSGSTLYAVLYPSAACRDAHAFWQRAGPGISSRLAQRCLRSSSRPRIHPFTAPTTATAPPDTHSVYEKLRCRIAGHVRHWSSDPRITKQVAPSDVFLYASGMAAIYHVHQSILAWRTGESVNAGLLYGPTLSILQAEGQGLRSYNLGTEADLNHLAAQLELGSGEARAVQAIWCECPSNLTLQTVNLQRIRRLADQHGIPVVVDDSIASFANLDLLGVADIIVSSLSKYFSGYADVMAGRQVNVILNPNSPHYAALHKQISATYENNLFVEDAIRLESNSRNFLPRMDRVNKTTQHLVTQLLPLVSDPASPLTRIFHPSVCASRPNYERQMRAPSSEMPRPGYGGVFTMEFADIASASVFFDHLHVCKGLSFGADVCIASPYMQMTGQAGKKQALVNGTNDTIIRFAVGLEEPDEVLHRINTALDAATLVYRAKGHVAP
ncbi:PLP-dependent transferase [Aspergillus heteromorphus CBS 117.55]|uniref:PLP-dependent transferase n=1 Tax=Aspergillus heteromorphus CBS 117.55 TaxID=1448321 RepID=A0A317WSN1_9EURO|nr:PLP-dependent transferase [Aspergillus heteromorphus CBS 117.55]PWY88167.1 PLP-dependent transferase [Aspergillus heteromorphus CBS 117.55]